MQVRKQESRVESVEVGSYRRFNLNLQSLRATLRVEVPS